MNPFNNPYAAGAGLPPAVLAGREALRDRVRIGITRLRLGRPAKSVLMVGLRGVGKTVLLEQMRLEAEGEGVHTLHLADTEMRSLPAVLADQLHLVLQRLSQIKAATDSAQRALRALAGFAQGLKGTFTDVEDLVGFETEAGLGNNGDLEGDMTVVLEHAGLAVKAAGTALVIFIDEFQRVEKSQLGALIAALHRCTQTRLPVMLVGAGLPSLRGRASNAKSYAERLFDYPVIGPLSEVEAALAIMQPAEKEGVAFQAEAVDLIVEKTRGYPFFLQELASQAWDAAATNPITLADVKRASTAANTTLDERFFRVHFARLTSMEKQYLRAMAELGPGPHRSGEIANRQGRRVQAFVLLRNGLIAKGMIWSSNHGDTAFTVPFFDEFMKRIMLDDDRHVIS